MGGSRVGLDISAPRGARLCMRVEAGSALLCSEPGPSEPRAACPPPPRAACPGSGAPPDAQEVERGLSCLGGVLASGPQSCVWDLGLGACTGSLCDRFR